MTPLCYPTNEADLALVKSLLVAEDIPYFVHNDHFGSLVPAPIIPLYNAKTVFVAKTDLARAKEIIANIEDPAPELKDVADRGHSIADKVRMFLEVVLFGWIMPGRRKT